MSPWNKWREWRGTREMNKLFRKLGSSGTWVIRRRDGRPPPYTTVDSNSWWTLTLVAAYGTTHIVSARRCYPRIVQYTSAGRSVHFSAIIFEWVLVSWSPDVCNCQREPWFWSEQWYFQFFQMPSRLCIFHFEFHRIRSNIEESKKKFLWEKCDLLNQIGIEV